MKTWILISAVLLLVNLGVMAQPAYNKGVTQPNAQQAMPSNKNQVPSSNDTSNRNSGTNRNNMYNNGTNSVNVNGDEDETRGPNNAPHPNPNYPSDPNASYNFPANNSGPIMNATPFNPGMPSSANTPNYPGRIYYVPSSPLTPNINKDNPQNIQDSSRMAPPHK